MFTADHGLVVRQADGDVRADHVPGHGRSVPLGCCVTRVRAPRYGDAGPAYRHHAGANMQGSYIGQVAVGGAHRSAAALADAAG